MPPSGPEVSTASSNMSNRGDWILAEFEQHAASRRGMNEDVEVPSGADLDLVRDQPHAPSLKIFKRCRNVVYMNCHVMETLSALGDELGNDRIRRGPLQKFQAAFAGRHECSTNFLMFDNFFAYDLHPELLVEFASFSNALHRDAQMINLKHASLRPAAVSNRFHAQPFGLGPLDSRNAVDA